MRSYKWLCKGRETRDIVVGCVTCEFSPKELVAVSVAPVAAETAAIVQTAPVETAVVAPVTG